jgi:hypothetical protein
VRACAHYTSVLETRLLCIRQVLLGNNSQQWIFILLFSCSRPCCMAAGSQLTHDHLAVTDWLTAKLLVAHASTVILGSEPHGTHDHTLLSDGCGSLQTLASLIYSLGTYHMQNHFPQLVYCVLINCSKNMFWLLLPSNGCLLWLSCHNMLTGFWCFFFLFRQEPSIKLWSLPSHH